MAQQWRCYSAVSQPSIKTQQKPAEHAAGLPRLSERRCQPRLAAQLLAAAALPPLPVQLQQHARASAGILHLETAHARDREQRQWREQRQLLPPAVPVLCSGQEKEHM